MKKSLVKKYLATLALFTCSTPVFAFFCPGSFNQINIGDPLQQVLLLCGKPAVQNVTKNEPSVPQEWNYYVKPNSANPTSLKMSVAFVDDKAVNISVNGTSITNSQICGKTIALGDTTTTVKAACGDAAFINKGATPPPGSGSTGSAAATATEITEFTYTNTSPPVVLIFEGGKLKERK